jgi:hypothetical protein
MGFALLSSFTLIEGIRYPNDQWLLDIWQGKGFPFYFNAPSFINCSTASSSSSSSS